jgi:hypothetical protein
LIFRRQVFKQEHLKVLGQQAIAADKIANSLPLGDQFLLHAADEYKFLHEALCQGERALTTATCDITTITTEMVTVMGCAVKRARFCAAS